MREPNNSKYCKAVKCRYRNGNKCIQDSCTRLGNEKRSIYFTKHDKLAEGDIPEKSEAIIDDSNL